MIYKIKLILIASTIILAIILGIVYLSQTNSNNLQKSQTFTTPFPLPSPSFVQTSSIPQGKSYTISGVQINNFYETAKEVKLDGEVIIEENEDYRIMYFPEREYFLISIYSSPFENSRQVAEQSFMKILGISPSKACKLHVSITTPAFVNPKEAGTDYHLSFCKE